MRKEKNSDTQLIQAYRKTIRGPSSDDPEFYDYVKKECEAFKRKDPSCEIYRLYLRLNATKKGRTARFRKKTTFYSWLFIKIGNEERVIEYLNTFSRLPVKKKKRDDWKRLDEISGKLIEEGIIDYFDISSLYRHKKSKAIEKALAIIRLDSGIELRERQGERAFRLEKEFHKFKNFSPQMVEFMFMESTKKKYLDSTLLKKNLKEFILADKFLGKIIDDIRKSGGSMKLGKIRKKHTKTISELKPYLRYLKDERLAFQKNGTIFLNCYDPGNNKKFMWIADSCYWKFGPKLEKGKVYNSNDFIRQDVTDQWVKTGAARYI